MGRSEVGVVCGPLLASTGVVSWEFCVPHQSGKAGGAVCFGADEVRVLCSPTSIESRIEAGVGGESSVRPTDFDTQVRTNWRHYISFLVNACT